MVSVTTFIDHPLLHNKHCITFGKQTQIANEKRSTVPARLRPQEGRQHQKHVLVRFLFFLSFSTQFVRKGSFTPKFGSKLTKDKKILPSAGHSERKGRASALAQKVRLLERTIDSEFIDNFAHFLFSSSEI